jgi:hypothetical protein
MCQEHPAVLADPAPAIKVQKLSGAGVLFVVRPWVETKDYWQTYWELNREAQIRLAKPAFMSRRFDMSPTLRTLIERDPVASEATRRSASRRMAPSLAPTDSRRLASIFLEKCWT